MNKERGPEEKSNINPKDALYYLLIFTGGITIPALFNNYMLKRGLNEKAIGVSAVVFLVSSLYLRWHNYRLSRELGDINHEAIKGWYKVELLSWTSFVSSLCYYSELIRGN